jgi:hypothetical protein
MCVIVIMQAIDVLGSFYAELTISRCRGTTHIIHNLKFKV